MLKKVFFTVFIFCLAWLVWRLIAPAKVIRVDGSAIYVENLPMTSKGKISWWKENERRFQDQYGLIKNKENFYVIVMNFEGYTSLPTGSNDGSVDDYHCFDDIKEKERCIYNDIALMIHGNVNETVFYGVDKKMYIETPDGKLTLREE
ncbi:hypothetical protein AFK62_04450 [Cronobacter condimenti 1330]|uniref:DUF943 family protein n=2 Tax=Cronobacter condimenti TaxID=1163710 RepID=A0ABM5V9C8_9ENTR|nr:DUF943 family protein [Cronobacter condimenti]ALB61792.1 hypothetical protein AFK62_04450 [Cronobacter condimenti 1330]